ncbi:hypothetical protein Tco_1202500 [Tanacetum coccineum]
MDRLPSDAIDEGPSSMKKWTNKFFLIDRIAIPDYLTWRHSYSCISNDFPLDGYDQNDVEQLCVHLTRLREMKEAVLVRSGLSSVWSNQKCDPVFRRTSDNSRYPVPLPTLDEVFAAQPDPVLAKKSKALVKQKDSSSLVVPSGPDQPSKKKWLRKKASKAGSSAPVLDHTENVKGTDISNFCADIENSLERDEGVISIGSSGKARAEVMRWQLDPLIRWPRIDLTLFPLALGPYVMPYPFEGDSSLERALDRTITPVELKRTESLLPSELSNWMSVLTTLLASHGTKMNSRYTALVASKENKELRSFGDVLSEDFRKLKVQLAKAKATASRSSDELAQTDAKLSDQCLVMRDLQNDIALEKSKSQEYRDDVVIAEHRFDGLKDEVTHFVSSGVVCLIHRLLSSDEFNYDLAHVLYLGITSGVERGLLMGRTDAAFEEAAQNVSNFFIGSQAEFDKAVAAFPSTNFHFLSKVAATARGALSEVVNIQPDKIVCSATPASVLAATLSANEALNCSSTPEEPEHAHDVSSSLV